MDPTGELHKITQTLISAKFFIFNNELQKNNFFFAKVTNTLTNDYNPFQTCRLRM